MSYRNSYNRGLFSHVKGNEVPTSGNGWVAPLLVVLFVSVVSTGTYFLSGNAPL